MGRHGEAREELIELSWVKSMTTRQAPSRVGQRPRSQGQRDSAAYLRALPDMLFRINKEGRYLDFKPAKDFEPFVPQAQFMGKLVSEVLPRGVADSVMLHIERAVKTVATQTYEYSLPMAEELRDYEARIVPLGGDDVLAIVRDITDRRRFNPRRPAALSVYGLTAREIVVLRLITIGMTDAEVGSRLNISRETARKHAAAIRRKMGAASRTDASVRAVKEGLL